MFRLFLSSLVLLSACACDDEAPCSSTYGRNESALSRGGGWDANGQSMYGLSIGAIGLAGAKIISAELDGEAIEVFDVGEKGLVARSESGWIRSGVELMGATLVVEDSFEQHTVHIDRADTTTFVRYQISIDDLPTCTEGQMGVFVNGKVGLTFSCEAGAVYKCVGWGYAPWSGGDDLHQACTRLVRADYCGDGRSFTLNGTLIWVSGSSDFDRGQMEEFTREAGWGPNGAVCIDHQRYDAYTQSGDEVSPACLSNLPACDGRERGALLYNGSARSALTVCEF